MNPFDYVDALIGFDIGPINFPLWFIRDLMLLIILSPLLYLLITRSKGIFLAVLFALWIGIIDANLFISSEALLFFSSGLFLARIKSIELPNKLVTYILCIIYILSSMIEAHLRSAGSSLPLFHEFNILTGCVAIFAFSTSITKTGGVGSVLRLLSATSFFVYVAHGPLLQVFRKIPYVFLDPQDDLMYVGIYFFAPVATITLLTVLYFRMLPFLPIRLRDVAFGKISVKHNIAMEATAYKSASSKRSTRSKRESP